MKCLIKHHYRRLKKTRNHRLRWAVGILLMLGGIIGFLPVVGFWMFPLGLALLAVDSPRARRLYRRSSIWWGRRFQKTSKKNRRTAAAPDKTQSYSQDKSGHSS